MSKMDVMAKARAAVEKSGLTYLEIGKRMGYAPESARQSVSQLLRGKNPTVVMLQKLAKAIGVDPGDLV